MYVQANGIECKAWRKYDRNSLKTVRVLFKEFYVSMDNVNLANAAGMRCWDTKPVVGMIKRPNAWRC